MSREFRRKAGSKGMMPINEHSFLNISDYRTYGFEIIDDESGGHVAFCKYLAGGGMQDGEGKSIYHMTKWFVLDNADFAFKMRELAPPARELREGETPIDIGLGNAVKIAWRNLMVSEGMKPGEMARMMRNSPQTLHRHMCFDKSTGIDVIEKAFSALGHPLELTVPD